MTFDPNQKNCLICVKAGKNLKSNIPDCRKNKLPNSEEIGELVQIDFIASSETLGTPKVVRLDIAKCFKSSNFGDFIAEKKNQARICDTIFTHS